MSTLNEQQFSVTHMRTMPPQAEGKTMLPGYRSPRQTYKTESREMTRTERGIKGGKWKPKKGLT